MPVDTFIQAYDVVGFGFGPSNLAIAGAFLENQPDSPISIDRILFIERHDEFKWHPGMLLPGVEMQINFLKDLATLRSPQSPLTFVSYLHSQSRLLDFINRGRTTPTRKEYSDYLSWAAKYVQDKGVKVAFGEEIVALGEMNPSTIQVHSRILSTGQHVVRLAKNLIVSPGGSPHIPRPLMTTWVRECMIHSSTYSTSVTPLFDLLQSRNPGRNPLRISVIGSGQSAAEIVIDLHSRLTAIPVSGDEPHSLELIIRKGSLKPSDDSPFVNEIFNPDAMDRIYQLPSHSDRQKICLEYSSTNYGVVNRHTLELLYEIVYDQKLDEGISRRTNHSPPLTKPKFTILNHTEVISANASYTTDGGSTMTEADWKPITLILQQTLTRNVHENSYDAVFCATGYERRSWLHLLTNSSLSKHFGLDPDPDVQGCTRLEVETSMQNCVINGHGSSTFGAGDVAQSNSPNVPWNVGSNISKSLGWASDWPREGRGSLTKKLYISRAYRLLPAVQGELQARIYVQGLAEETHGLSDTLLSVVGIRAGEVVDDLCAGFVRNDTGDTQIRARM